MREVSDERGRRAPWAVIIANHAQKQLIATTFDDQASAVRFAEECERAGETVVVARITHVIDKANL